jgi:hypothetical protein
MEPMKLKNLGTEATGQPVYEVDGIKYRYAGKSDEGDLVGKPSPRPRNSCSSR